VRACVRVVFWYAPANLLAINGRCQEKTHRKGVLSECPRCAGKIPKFLLSANLSRTFCTDFCTLLLNL